MNPNDPNVTLRRHGAIVLERIRSWVWRGIVEPRVRTGMGHQRSLVVEVVVHLLAVARRRHGRVAQVDIRVGWQQGRRRSHPGVLVVRRVVACCRVWPVQRVRAVRRAWNRRRRDSWIAALIPPVVGMLERIAWRIVLLRVHARHGGRVREPGPRLMGRGRRASAKRAANTLRRRAVLVRRLMGSVWIIAARTRAWRGLIDVAWLHAGRQPCVLCGVKKLFGGGSGLARAERGGAECQRRAG